MRVLEGLRVSDVGLLFQGSLEAVEEYTGSIFRLFWRSGLPWIFVAVAGRRSADFAAVAYHTGLGFRV